MLHRCNLALILWTLWNLYVFSITSGPSFVKQNLSWAASGIPILGLHTSMYTFWNNTLSWTHLLHDKALKRFKAVAGLPVLDQTIAWFSTNKGRFMILLSHWEYIWCWKSSMNNKKLETTCRLNGSGTQVVGEICMRSTSSPFAVWFKTSTSSLGIIWIPSLIVCIVVMTAKSAALLPVHEDNIKGNTPWMQICNTANSRLNILCWACKRNW